MIKMKKLPKGWGWKKLEEVCQLIKGKKPKEIFEEKRKGYLPYVLVDSFNKEHTKFTNEINLPKCEETDVLMIMDGSRSGLISFGLNGVIGSTLAAIRIKDKNKLNPKFLYYFLKTKYFLFNSQTSGSAIPHVDKSLLKSLKIPLPPLPTQKKIVEILDKVEKLKTRRADANAETNKILQSVFLEMFGDPVKNEKGWEIKKLEEISLNKGEYGSGAKAIPYSKSIPRYIRITDIDEKGKLNEDKVSPSKIEERYILGENDLLFARSGATVGKTYLHNKENGNCIFAGYLIRFKINSKLANPKYIFHFTKTLFYKNWVKSKMKTVAQPNINARQYSQELKIPIPPLKLQNQFAEIVEKVEKIKQRQKDSTKEINDLFNSLMQKAFKGELN